MTELFDRSHNCCICQEVYDGFDRKPLLLPCTHSFCKSCLRQMQTNREKVCPVCRSDWTEHSIDSLVFIRQLVPPEDRNEENGTKLEKLESSTKNACIGHVFAFWCKSCQVSVCKQCLQKDHKLCDWICDEEKIQDLKKVLQETAKSTRKDLADLFSRVAADNIANLSNVRGLMRRLQKSEKCFTMLEKLIPLEKDSAMRSLECLQNQPAEASVADYTTAIANARSLCNDHIQYPKTFDFTFQFKSRNSAAEDITDLRISEDTTNDVSEEKKS